MKFIRIPALLLALMLCCTACAEVTKQSAVGFYLDTVITLTAYVEDVEVVSSGILQLGINGIEGKKISVSRRRVVALKRALGL